MLSPRTSSPFMRSPLPTSKLENWSDTHFARSRKRACLPRPPVREVALEVELAPLVVEAVNDLVADDRSDPAVVVGIVGIRVVEGGCRMPAGNTISFIGDCCRR